MSFLLAIADAFYRTFGITEPTESTRRRAAFYLLLLMLFIPAVIALVVFAVSRSIR